MPKTANDISILERFNFSALSNTSAPIQWIGGRVRHPLQVMGHGTLYLDDALTLPKMPSDGIEVYVTSPRAQTAGGVVISGSNLPGAVGGIYNPASPGFAVIGPLDWNRLKASGKNTLYAYNPYTNALDVHPDTADFRACATAGEYEQRTLRKRGIIPAPLGMGFLDKAIVGSILGLGTLAVAPAFGVGSVVSNAGTVVGTTSLPASLSLTSQAVSAGLSGQAAITSAAMTAGGASAATAMSASAALTGSGAVGLIGGAMPILSPITGNVIGTTATIAAPSVASGVSVGAAKLPSGLTDAVKAATDKTQAAAGNAIENIATAKIAAAIAPKPAAKPSPIPAANPTAENGASLLRLALVAGSIGLAIFS